MQRQSCRLDFNEVRLHILDNPTANCRGQKIDNCTVNVGCRCERPPTSAARFHDFRNLVGKLFINATINFCFDLPFRD